MSWNENSILQEPSGEWGGPWTQKKLDAFSKYVWSYLTIMKTQTHWKTIYFDGFAGSGNKKRDKTEINEIYRQLKITEEDENYKGAAERVISLKDNLSFDYYYFIDKEKAAIDKLGEKISKLPAANGKNLVFRSGDANEQLLNLAKALQNTKFAALIFLDPFGMQIDWASIQALKDTRSDIWILIPTGVIVNRLLEKDAELTHLDKLVSFFGINEDEIRGHFYRQEIVQTLFGTAEITSKVAQPIEKIARLYATRLKTIWNFVTEVPLRLNNRTGAPLFHFVFASNNANALKIAKQIIQKV